MTILAIGAERAQVGWKQLRPFGRFLRQLSGGGFDVLRGLVEAYWQHPTTSRTSDRLDQRVAENRSQNAANVFASRPLTTGLQNLGHVHLRRGNVASFAAPVKVARDDAGWSLGRRIIELGPEDEI